MKKKKIFYKLYTKENVSILYFSYITLLSVLLGSAYMLLSFDAGSPEQIHDIGFGRINKLKYT